jgi:hypothetical protein
MQILSGPDGTFKNLPKINCHVTGEFVLAGQLGLTQLRHKHSGKEFFFIRCKLVTKFFSHLNGIASLWGNSLHGENNLELLLLDVPETGDKLLNRQCGCMV